MEPRRAAVRTDSVPRWSTTFSASREADPIVTQFTASVQLRHGQGRFTEGLSTLENISGLLVPETQGRDSGPAASSASS